MNFKKARIKDYYLRDTQIENFVIAEYLLAPEAEGDFIKVYLMGLMYAGYEGMSNTRIAQNLGMSELDVLRAWEYWERVGIIARHYPDPEDRFHFSVEFLSMREKFYSQEMTAEEEAGVVPRSMEDEDLKQLFDSIQEITGQLLDHKEMEGIDRLLTDYNLSSSLILYGYRYCRDRSGVVKFSYVAKVLKDWEAKNIRTTEAAEKYLAEADLRHSQYKRVLKALGLFRYATEEEQRRIDRWFDDLGYDMDRVLEACAKSSGISNPNINYVDSVLQNWYNESNGAGAGGQRGNSGGTAAGGGGAGGRGAGGKANANALIKKMYDETRERNKKEQEQRRGEVYAAIPRVKEIEGELRSLHMDLSRSAIFGGSKSGLTPGQIREGIQALEAEEAGLLGQLGHEADYLELRYDCSKCGDTGVLGNGERCSCYSEKLKTIIVS